MYNQRSTYEPAIMTTNCNGHTILPCSFTPEALASRTEAQVAGDDIALWVLVLCTGGFQMAEGVGTTDEIEARHTTDSEADLKFRKQVKEVRDILGKADTLFDD